MGMLELGRGYRFEGEEPNAWVVCGRSLLQYSLWEVERGGR